LEEQLLVPTLLLKGEQLSNLQLLRPQQQQIWQLDQKQGDLLLQELLLLPRGKVLLLLLLGAMILVEPGARRSCRRHSWIVVVVVEEVPWGKVELPGV
jgi:hypothetical protein